MRQFVLCITIFCLLCAYTRINAATTVDSLVGCLRSKGVLNYTTSGSPFYSTALDFSMQNLRFTEAGVPKPAVIILPSTAQEVQKAWTCMLRGGWALRVRNGGHSYEGLSSSASAPFAIIDLINMHKITVNVQKKTAWIEAGVRIGELYHAIASQSSNRLGFPAGTCSTVGMSGQIMGGGYGMLSRKYGVAADRVLQAQVIDGNGKLIKRVSTSNPDLFWALRGGGGGAWGIVVAWKLKLVDLPETITTFSLWKTGKQVITDLVYKWQTIAPKAPPELFIAIYMAGISYTGSPDMGASFYGQYWGTINETLALLNKIYPELGLSESDCKQGNWMQAATTMAGLSDPDALLNRQQSSRNYFKGKSDFVSKPLTKAALSAAYDIMVKNTKGWMIFEPYGGVISRIPSSAIAFPHREGRLFMIQYQAVWAEDSNSSESNLIEWLRGLYSYMAPFATYTPSRAAYVNYIDLDLGDGMGAGKSYFGANFVRLVEIKARFDPSDVFNQPQSVPVTM